MNTCDDAAFEGAKLALFLGARLVVILRDNVADLPYAGHWDLPGGGREGGETPLACVQRECFEELGLRIEPQDIVWGRRFSSASCGERVWFYVGHLPSSGANDIVFGDEGQGWQLMEVAEFLRHPKAIPAFQDRLRVYLAECE
ncbi:NUDIX hydrolase [Sulfitobacter geojensis]|uniref:NUDIX hydrolase n=1 Tax=Sulfitobacter geojensis TaxID=1342299 RepID=UPI00046814D3|nr:NUDIX hydrolase [Sulfitobacter geojensis]KHA50818.1 Nudix hydrolase family protein [Sulfitobacter geojensis]NYI26805.1 8-oxo-dGTP diphosphatase [Sulfitobacter geojensis]